jgi:hypothetical protein
MQMAASIVANEFIGHGTGQESKPRRFKTERVGHPKQLNQFLTVDVLELYNPTYAFDKKKLRKGLATRLNEETCRATETDRGIGSSHGLVAYPRGDCDSARWLM